MRSLATALKFNRDTLPPDILERLIDERNPDYFGFDWDWWHKETTFAIWIHHDGKYTQPTLAHLELLQYATGCINTSTGDDSLDLFDVSGEEPYNIKFSDINNNTYTFEQLQVLAGQGKLKFKREFSYDK